jgi:hypothetical protein
MYAQRVVFDEVVSHTGSSAQGTVGDTRRAAGGGRLSGSIDLRAVSGSKNLCLLVELARLCYGAQENVDLSANVLPFLVTHLAYLISASRLACWPQHGLFEIV